MRLQAHVSPARWQALKDAYEAHLKAAVEADLPDYTPPAANGQPVATTLNGSEPSPAVADVASVATDVADRQRWGQLSRRSLRVGLSPTVWESLRSGDYTAAGRVIAALEQAPATTGEG